MSITNTRRGAVMLLCALLAGLMVGGCAPVSYDNPSTRVSPPPLPTSPPAPEAPVGDSVAESVSRQTLYSVSADGRTISGDSVDVKVEAGQSLAEAMMAELLLKDEIIPQGTRLLSIVKQMILLHGGNVLVESEEDKGTIFTVVLPI